MPGFNVQGIGDPKGGSSTQEFAYTYTWKIFEMFGSAATGDSDLLVNAKDVTLPTFSVGIETQQGASLEYKFAKNVSYDDVKVTFYDAIYPSLLDLMIKWRKTVWTDEVGLKTAEQYKKNSRFDILGPSGVEVSRWNLIGSWPSTIRHGELTYTSSDVKIVEVTVTYDYAEEEEQQ